jgi:arginase family enzyme
MTPKQIACGGLPMPDGLWPEGLDSALRVALSSPRVAGMDITIYNPAFDDPERSAARTLAACVVSVCVHAT